MHTSAQTKSGTISNAGRDLISEALQHLDHILPAQAPILDFVHHNTLHGFQHLPFAQALADYEALTGVSCYLPEARFREFYQQGRINDADLAAAFAQQPDLALEQVLCSKNDRVITRQDVYRIAMLYDLQAMSISQVNWQIEELNALASVQADVPEAVRLQFLGAANEADVIRQLWASILNKLDMQQEALYPEELLELSLEQAENWLAGNDVKQTPDELSIHQQMQQHAGIALDEMFAQLGENLSMRGFLLALSGIDILDSVRTQLIRICASCLDEGVAAWRLPEHRQKGLYATWRAMAQYDANLFLIDFRDQQGIMNNAPEDAVDAIILQLTQLEIPQQQWSGYLQRLALELPGWSGMINWRQQHPNYHANQHVAPTLADYLAIRLTLDSLWLKQICRDIWKVDAKLSSLQGYFRKNLSEFLVRKSVYEGKLPEYLTQQAIALTSAIGSERHSRSEWQKLADLFWNWQFSTASPSRSGQCLFDGGWRLFRLCQHLGINALWIHHLQKDDLLQLLALLDEFSGSVRNKIWLNAYEHHYREEFFQALQANRNRGRWAQREQRPSAQIIFCMDDREESFRRHLEEYNPGIETLGAAGFFGVAMNYKGLDDDTVTPLCPVVVTPIHEVQEQPQPGTKNSLAKHQRGRKFSLKIANLWHHGLRRNLISSQPLLQVCAPLTLINLLSKSVAPKMQHTVAGKLCDFVVPNVASQLLFTSTESTPATAAQPKLGFTDAEQADRVAGFLRNTGLTYGFAPLVVLMGHGSISENNPHLAAYDCGACSGRHGGPNARVFAAMANRPEIRLLLAERGIEIPADTFFIGAEHNTCNEVISWLDAHELPEGHVRVFNKLQEDLRHAQHMSAHERCRRLASAPRKPSPVQALAHIRERAADFSQVRPELGHATNASAVVGRRSVTQGAFFDRRVFLISYDPTQDPSGSVLEGILLAVGPVGAGINLEYYFSTVNNERLGCGSKVPHNVTGFFGIMDGTGSDLRTGLPQQMVEIHEPMRLQMLIEAKTSVLEGIYARQESLRELISGGWIHLSTMDPDTGGIFVFQCGLGFVPWQAEVIPPPFFENSVDCYQEQTLPVAPALIKQPEMQEF
ncbi:MAG: DUF2309 domain-containing protein [Methylococcales bacterium]